MAFTIVFEGIDGSGKSTQVKYLKAYLESLGYSVICTEWFKNKYVKKLLAKYSRSQWGNSMGGALMIASEFTMRYYNIINKLSDDSIVIFDRYIYTSFVRDSIRGVPESLLRELYDFVIKPGLSEQSILKIVGYTVNSNDDYSDDYRHNVLKYAIAEEIFTKEKAIRHISWLIKLNENKSNMEESVKKWRSDRDYLRGYNEKKPLYGVHKFICN